MGKDFRKEEVNVELQKQIKPGEFTFCSRCGKICNKTDKDFMCTKCKINLLGMEEGEETTIHKNFEKMISDICVKYREELAKCRSKK